jgi:hypothetical protein
MATDSCQHIGLTDNRMVDGGRDAAPASRQVAWWPVHEFVVPVLDAVGTWPLVGTPAWCDLDHDDPAKVAAIFDAARHYALRIDTGQEQLAQASRDVSRAVDCTAIARGVQRRASGVYIPRRRADVGAIA